MTTTTRKTKTTKAITTTTRISRPRRRGAGDPSADCDACPRLVAYRRDNAAAQPAWWNAPVFCVGPLNARLLVVGLAPGLRGANRTGVPFTGDASGDWLFEALAAFAFTRSGAPSAADLHDAAITNAVRCAPPKNRPTGAETAACRPHLVARIGSMRSLRAIVALGRVAHETVLTAFGVRRAANPFAHGARHVLIDPHRQRRLDLFDSYHCSRYNVQTGRLSRVAFHSVFAAVRARLDGAEAADE